MPLPDNVQRRQMLWKFLTKLPQHRLTVRTEQGKFSFSSKDREIGRQLFVNKSFDFEKTRKFQQLLGELGYLQRRPGYLVDVGANVGTVCIPLVRNGVFPQALAFEPEARNYSLLAKNVSQNGLSRTVRTFNCALSNTEAEIAMELSADNYGDHRVRMADPKAFSDEQFTESSRRTVMLRACRLDDVLRRESIEPDQIAALWLDVQGHEKYVLEGAESVLSSGAPVLAEFWPYGLSRAGVTPEAFIEFLSLHFDAYYDLKPDDITRQDKREFASLFERYQGIDFTDLLLVSRETGTKVSSPVVDVKELISKYSVEDLNQAAEDYWVGMRNSRQVRSKPYGLSEIQHLLVQIAHLVGGLSLYPGLTVLDFGAGTCYASRILNQLGMRVISCDVSATALEIGRELSAKYPPIGEQPEHIFLRFDGRRFDLPDASVDRVFCLDALHHVSSQKEVLQEMSRVLVDGGIAGFSEPGPTHSLHPDSQFAMRNYTVIENDIVLSEIFEHARSFGFTDIKIAVAPIHPTFVPASELEAFFASPGPFVAGIKNRVLNYPIFFLYKGVTRESDSSVGDGLVGVLRVSNTEIVGNSRTALRFSVEAENSSSKVWRASGRERGCVNLGGFLHVAAPPHHDIVPSKEYRFSLSLQDVQPRERVSATIDLGLLQPGGYIMDIDLVSEHVCWFERNCNSKLSIPVRVVP